MMLPVSYADAKLQLSDIYPEGSASIDITRSKSTPPPIDTTPLTKMQTGDEPHLDSKKVDSAIVLSPAHKICNRQKVLLHEIENSRQVCKAIMAADKIRRDIFENKNGS